MGSLAYREDLEEEKNSAFTWELEANSRDYNSQFKEKSFLCWQRRKYESNVIHTAKYNVFSFLPLNLYEQFHRVSNLYFLFIIILQGLPEISTLPWFTLFVPLICLLVIRATRDLVDDIGRHRSDRIINNRPCQILVGKSFLWRKWEDLCVGDVVCLHKDNIVPADLLLLASTEPSSLCYVETADIDGETNLKFRQAPPVTHHELTSIRKMASFQGQHLLRLYVLFMKRDRFESNSFGGLIEKAACGHGLAIRLHGGPATRRCFISSCLVAKAGCSDWFGSRISVLSHSPFAPDIHAPAARLISGGKPRSWGGWLHVSPPLPLGPDLTERCCEAWPHFSEEETGVREVAGGVGLLPVRVPVHTPWPF